MSLILNKRTTPLTRSPYVSASRYRSRPIQNTIQGFTLIEVLVSLIIIAIGLLGLAGMQIHGMQGNNGSVLRTQANLIANDIATRMRVNKAAMDNSIYALADYSIACASQTPPDCTSASCTSSEIAELDIADFICDSENNLPNVSSTTISCNDNDLTDADDCSLGSPHTITLSWAESISTPNNASLADINKVNSISLVVRP